MIKSAGAILAACILIGSLVVINPMLVGQGRLQDFLQSMARKTEFAVIQYDEVLGSGSSQFLYRGDTQRSGVMSVQKQIETMKVESVGPQLNYGIHTASKSSVAVDSSGYYIGTDEGKFNAYDFTGKLRWTIDSISSVRGIHGTATTDDLYVYVGNYRGHLFCIRKSDGKIMWDSVVADAIGTSPLLVGDFLYVTAEFNGKGGLVAKISRRTGEKIWSSEVFGEQSHSSPAISSDGRVVVVGDNAGFLRGLNSRTGDRSWIQKLGGEIKGTPLIAGDSVYVGSWGKDFCSFSALTGEKNWCVSLSGVVQASAAIDPLSGDLLVQTANKTSLLRLRARDGSVIWKQNYSVGSRIGISSPVVLTNPKKSSQILMGCKKKTICILDMKTGKEIAWASLPNTYSSVPSAFNDLILIALDEGGIATIRWK